MSKIVQVQLEGAGNMQLVTWVDYHPKLKQGSIISLKDLYPDVKWVVRHIWDSQISDLHDFDFHRKWDNNNYDKHKGVIQ